jgi:hypothetical protein
LGTRLCRLAAAVALVTSTATWTAACATVPAARGRTTAAGARAVLAVGAHHAVDAHRRGLQEELAAARAAARTARRAAAAAAERGRRGLMAEGTGGAATPDACPPRPPWLPPLFVPEPATVCSEMGSIVSPLAPNALPLLPPLSPLPSASMNPPACTWSVPPTMSRIPALRASCVTVPPA